jgi:hypothetical protein
MNNLHAYYDQLTEENRQAVDRAYRAMAAELKDSGLRIDGDDTAERVVDAIARGIIESLPEYAYAKPLTAEGHRRELAQRDLTTGKAGVSLL